MRTGQTCKGTTKKGEPCKKDAYEDTGYCRQHQAQAPVPSGTQLAESDRLDREADRSFGSVVRAARGTAEALRLHVSQRGPRPRRERSRVRGTRPLALHHQKKTPRGVDLRAKIVQQEYRRWQSDRPERVEERRQRAERDRLQNAGRTKR